MEKHAKMKEKIILLGLCISFLIICASGANCDQKQIDYYVNTSQFLNAAVCADANKDYDHAIEYHTKSIRQSEENNQSTALDHILIAKYYSKKGSGFEDKIRAHCTIGEKLLLERISQQLDRPNPLYGSVQSDYRSLGDCYNLIDDKEKTCEYCSKCNEYGAKAGYKIVDCSGLFGCPKALSNPISTESTTTSSQGVSSLYLILGAFILLILLAALFLSKKKKK
jgi:tetratricopeptide (TPR) repeat protein